MKKLFLFAFGLLLFFYPLAIQLEEIAEPPSPDQEEIVRYLHGEDMYQGTFIWQGNQLSSKFNYEMTAKKKKLIETH